MTLAVPFPLLPSPPQTPPQLHAFVRDALGIDVPKRALVAGNSPPFDYLMHAFFEDAPGPRDCIVWANRGGGKTMIGALATLFDVAFKPGIQIRILAGSFDQASRMYAYLRDMLERDPFRGLLHGNSTATRLHLTNGSGVEVLSQSQRSVRGHHVHKLRCDEVELIDEDIWRAAQMVCRSGDCGGVQVRGAIEVISTMHKPYGLMQRLLHDAATSHTRRIFRWNVIDVLELCPPARRCETCPLFDACGGAAKNAAGFFQIDDAIAQMQRISHDAWQSEMLCERPSTRDRVYPEFEPAVHVVPFGGAGVPPVASDSARHTSATNGTWLGGIDFGYRSPTVVLWAHHDRDRDILHIVDEHVARERTASFHIDAASTKPWPRPAWLAADPAGRSRNEQTGRSTIRLWRDAGWTIRARSSRIEAGVELVRARLRAADGAVRLLIEPRCQHLIRSLLTYHYPPDRDDDPNPAKDGPDHAADALRYLVTNLDDRSGALTTRSYV